LNDTNIVQKIETVNTDTLRQPDHFFYLTDLPLRQVAQLILSDSVRPIDNTVTFQCMDSILSNNEATRNFYFPVFLRILEKADGALAEVVGQYAMTYIEEFPKEFAIKHSSLVEEQLESLASGIGFELYYKSQTEEDASPWIDTVIQNCLKCDSTQLSRLIDFNKRAISAMKYHTTD